MEALPLDNRLQVVMTGPLPPAIGGMVTVIGDLARSSLRQRVRLDLFNTGKTTPPGRSLWQGVRARLSLTRQWWKLLRSYPGESPIVHIHTCSGLTYFLDGSLLLLARLRGCPTVLHIHGGRFDAFLDGLPQPVRWAAATVARHADRVVVLSEDWRLRLAGHLPGAHLAIVHNGVPQIIVADSAERHREQQVRLLFMGSLSRGKGCLELVRAMQDLPDNVYLSLVGGEEDSGFAGQLKEEITRLGLGEHVEMPGASYGDAKLAHFGNADIFVLPSHAEGLPMAMLEAMSAGLPVIATRVGAIPAVIEGGKHGILVDPGDIAGLRAAIVELVTDVDKRRALGQAARARWREKFTIDHTVTELLALYSSLLVGRQAPR